MFGEELHYRVKDVADLHDLSLRGNFVRVGSNSAERLAWTSSNPATAYPSAADLARRLQLTYAQCQERL